MNGKKRRRKKGRRRRGRKVEKIGRSKSEEARMKGQGQEPKRPLPAAAEQVSQTIRQSGLCGVSRVIPRSGTRSRLRP